MGKKNSKIIFIIEILVIIVISFFLLNYISISQNSKIIIKNTSKSITEFNKVTNQVQTGIYSSLEKSNIDLNTLNSTQNKFLEPFKNSFSKFQRLVNIDGIEQEVPNSAILIKEGVFR